MSVPDAPPAARPVAGILWMLVTGLSFVAVTAIVKHVGDAVPPAQSAFLRYVMGLVFFLPFIGRIRETRLDRRATGLFAARGLVHALGVVCWFFAMTRIPIAEVTAMNYLSPVYVTLGAAVFLGERLAARRIAAIIVALVGAAIILRPGIREVSPGHLAMVANGLLFAGSYLIAKIMADRVPALVVVAWLSVWVTIGLFPLALMQWVWPAWTDLAWLFLVAGFATAGHFTMTLAFRAAPLTVTQPVTFLQLIWATLLGALVFGEAADIFVILGGALIIAAISFITWREAMVRRRAITPAAHATKF